eukprot:jgi/Hompol1/3373/HPOL_006544-RA
MATTSWAVHRRYGIVIDAGSSGSRIVLYSWKDPRVPLSPSGSRKQPKQLIVIEKATEFGEHALFKIEPGISSLASDPSQIGSYLRPLLDYAASTIPADRHADTPIYLFATAGLRLIPKATQDRLLQGACDFVGQNYLFDIGSGCNRHFRVISGELEGIFGWLAVNYLKGSLASFNPNADHHSLYSFLDMGGASAQIVFSPTKSMAQLHDDDLQHIRLRLLDGSEVVYGVFSSTFLGFGTNQARSRFVNSIVAGKEDIPTPAQSSAPVVLQDPCLPRGLILNSSEWGSVSFYGTGSFDKCAEAIRPLLNKNIPCVEEPC